MHECLTACLEISACQCNASWPRSTVTQERLAPSGWSFRQFSSKLTVSFSQQLDLVFGKDHVKISYEMIYSAGRLALGNSSILSFSRVKYIFILFGSIACNKYAWLNV